MYTYCMYEHNIQMVHIDYVDASVDSGGIVVVFVHQIIK